MRKLLILACIVSLPVQANSLEDETLLRVIQGINDAQVILKEAEGYQQKNSQETFHYEWVESDLNKVKEGIYQKIRASYTQPKIIEPVTGDYIE
jgi:RAQPRD family integrative conjugative element protein